MTYPILDITETPEKIDFVLINHPEIAAVGRRRAEHPAGGGRHRQRDLRRDRRAHQARAVLAGPGEAGAVVGSQRNHDAKGPARCRAFLFWNTPVIPAGKGDRNHPMT